MYRAILGNGREKVLESFYRNRNKEIYFSEVLRETGLSQPAALNHLKALVEAGLVVSEKRGSNTFYRINGMNSMGFSLLSYFDCKTLEGLPGERKRAIAGFLDGLGTKPLIAVVFGSTAKKTYAKESDIDILLVFNVKEAKQEKLRKDVEATTGTNVQPFIIDYAYFLDQLLKKDDNLVIHAIKTGFVVAGHGYFYRAVLRQV